MTPSEFSTAQLLALGFMFTHDCMAMFPMWAAKGYYWNYSGVIKVAPVPRREVLFALERRGLVNYREIYRRECFNLTDEGREFFRQQPKEVEDNMDTKLLTKREIQVILLTRYGLFQQGRDAGHFTIEVWQQKPRTDAKVCTTWRGIKFCDVGFASMNYKDTWDAEYGVKMAVHKAIAAIAKRIAHGRGPFARCEVLLPPVTVAEVGL